MPSSSAIRRAVCAAAFGLLVLAPSARALTFTVVQTGPNTWVYNLTYDPFDNYSIFQSVTTITLNGLFGVTAATGPTSTDIPNTFGNTVNLAWTPQVLNGGTTVVWSHNGPGTGNYSIPLNVYGFSITASGAVNGLATFSTSGFALDQPTFVSLDVSGAIAGPTAVPEPGTGVLVGLGVIAGSWRLRRRRQHDR
ncbi:MAG: PEP-CTERM sorting domain-containing protein [Verrucomicrobia bacterium]|nr:PEP-CTERM sorting domain-containing protein [Verrucomicrobiota bacterium]